MTKAWRSSRAWLVRIMRRRIVRYASVVLVLGSLAACYIVYRARVTENAIEQLQEFESRGVNLFPNDEYRFLRLSSFVSLRTQDQYGWLFKRRIFDMAIEGLDDGQTRPTEEIEMLLKLLKRADLTFRDVGIVDTALPFGSSQAIADMTQADYVYVESSDADLSKEAYQWLRELRIVDLRLSLDRFEDHMVSQLPSGVSELTLTKTALTDRGLAQLAQFKRLRELDVRGTAVTDEAAIAFVKAVPSCKIWFGGPPSGRAEIGTSLTWYRTRAAVQRHSKRPPESR